jgi:hypothetical protein
MDRNGDDRGGRRPNVPHQGSDRQFDHRPVGRPLEQLPGERLSRAGRRD